MFTPIGRPRRLPFPLQNQVTNSNEVSIDGLTPNPVTWPEDSTQRIPVILSVSLDEWNAIASAVDVGADIAYPEQYVEVTWILYRNLVYAMSICSQIIECITNDTDVQNALINMLKNSEDFTDYMNERVTAITGELIGSKIVSGSCDNSVVAGKMVAIVERLNTNNEDFFEIIEVGTNDEERVSAVIGAIPGLNETPVDEIIDMLQSLLENLSENYAAAITEEWKDEVERDLYCIAKGKPDCSLTYQDLFDYFQQRAGSGLTVGALIRNVLEFVINGDFSSDELIASGMYAIQLGFILAGRDFNSINVPRIGAITRDALPSSKWEDWDECTDTWTKTWNFALNDVVGWDIGAGVFTPDVGFQNSGSGGTPYTADIGRDVTWPTGTALTRVRVGATSTTADGGAFRGVYYPEGGGAPQTGYTSNTGNYTMIFDANNPTPPRIEIQVSNSTVAGSNTIRFVTLEGTGDEPVWD